MSSDFHWSTSWNDEAGSFVSIYIVESTVPPLPSKAVCVLIGWREKLASRTLPPLSLKRARGHSDWLAWDARFSEVARLESYIYAPAFREIIH